MAVVTVRNFPDATYRALEVRAARHVRSIEAEIQAILEEAVSPPDRRKVGSVLTVFGKRHGGIDLDIVRDKMPAGSSRFGPVRFRASQGAGHRGNGFGVLF